MLQLVRRVAGGGELPNDSLIGVPRQYGVGDPLLNFRRQLNFFRRFVHSVLLFRRRDKSYDGRSRQGRQTRDGRLNHDSVDRWARARQTDDRWLDGRQSRDRRLDHDPVDRRTRGRQTDHGRLRSR